MNTDLEHRLSQIEAHLAHLERQNDELNEVVIEQGKLLQKLHAQVKRLTQSGENAELDRMQATNPRPPHYQ